MNAKAQSVPVDADLSDPLVTAVLVCWNHRRYVRASVQSVLNQTYKNIELIVFDNGSTDGSREELESLAREYGFRLICQDNIGVVRALNRGIKISKGRYFAPLATDDMWLVDKTAKQVAYFEMNKDVDLIFGNVRRIDADGREIDMSGEGPQLLGQVSFSDLVSSRVSVRGPTVMCRTTTLREFGGYDENLRIEDSALAYGLISMGYKVHGISDVLTLYRQHDANWTSQGTLWSDICAVGRKYCRSQEEYRQFVRTKLKGEFRSLASRRKLQAIRLLATEPIAWTWDDVGIGLILLLTPTRMISRMRQAIRENAMSAGDVS